MPIHVGYMCSMKRYGVCKLATASFRIAQSASMLLRCRLALSFCSSTMRCLLMLAAPAPPHGEATILGPHCLFNQCFRQSPKGALD